MHLADLTAVTQGHTGNGGIRGILRKFAKYAEDGPFLTHPLLGGVLRNGHGQKVVCHLKDPATATATAKK